MRIHVRDRVVKEPLPGIVLPSVFMRIHRRAHVVIFHSLTLADLRVYGRIHRRDRVVKEPLPDIVLLPSVFTRIHRRVHVVKFHSLTLADLRAYGRIHRRDRVVKDPLPYRNMLNSDKITTNITTTLYIYNYSTFNLDTKYTAKLSSTHTIATCIYVFISTSDDPSKIFNLNNTLSHNNILFDLGSSEYYVSF
jgi:hypothetical protein